MPLGMLPESSVNQRAAAARPPKKDSEPARACFRTSSAPQVNIQGKKSCYEYFLQGHPFYGSETK
jgi:hypothetical protein